MKILALLWTVCLVRLCSAGCWSCFSGSKTNDDDSPQATSTPVIPSPDHVDGTLITLDLVSPDDTNVDVDSSAPNIKKYFPKGDVSFYEVKEGTTSIWRAGANEFCRFVRVSLAGNKPITVSLNVRNNAEDKNITVKNFKKEGDSWKSIYGRLTNSDSRRTND
ncbi:signal peptide containing protein [Theileria equi strain WA]|uniref:Signal peptide containing protein n=1 Tax=Theileria equi strain WA TaxID=1537102 RepID=L1LBE5_THEEQ|nr:signal peptide containing protein [Theileria equi strain WA]EKX72594.1 signal peptide containing protein [Theileria equi strain WA]|eukprot:XP_004832046.1 signal peptide containing protein [Theileria equi strain WA]